MVLMIKRLKFYTLNYSHAHEVVLLVNTKTKTVRKKYNNEIR